jgi:hypothetical protein
MRRTTASADSLSTHAGWYQVVGPALSVVAAAAAANLVAPGFLGLASSFRHAAIAVPHRFGVGSGRPDSYKVSAHGAGQVISARASRTSAGSGSSAVRMCLPARIWTAR